MPNIRPGPCANIYKHGRLKTRKEMADDGTADIAAMRNMPDSIKNKNFDEIVSESKPITKELVNSIKELVDGIEVDLDEPLNPDDE